MNKQEYKEYMRTQRQKVRDGKMTQKKLDKLRGNIADGFKGVENTAKKSKWQYMKDWHDNRVNAIFDNPARGRTITGDSGTRYYDAYYRNKDMNINHLTSIRGQEQKEN